MNSSTVAILAAMISISTAVASDFGVDPTNADFRSGPIVSSWKPADSRPGYLFAGIVDRTNDAGSNPWTALTVGAQIVAVNRRGVHQIAFGIATEAWAEQGSMSMLTGLEASAVNREPDNPMRKIALWATFKNRPDSDYDTPPTDPANMSSEALRIESQVGTGFSRGIVFAHASLHASREQARPVAIDFAELPPGLMKQIDVMRFPDGCSLTYLGQGRLAAQCAKPANAP